MPVRTSISNLLSTRFDFGVPLEDIFPPNDIHPRLKYLFSKAFEAYIECNCGIEYILRQRQGPISEHLRLKEILVFDLDYHIPLNDFFPGSFFWIIRHFLGLLPLPLLPSYTKEVQYDWVGLAEKCKSFFQNYSYNRTEDSVLDNSIAETLNMLPFENFLLFNILVVFFRKIAGKNYGKKYVINRRSMILLAKFYCSSIFIRPFRPGCTIKNDTYLPLLLYVIIRWANVQKFCENMGHPAYFLECDLKHIETYKGLSLRDTSTQTTVLNNYFFNPDIITIDKKIPYFPNDNSYLKDIGCQTETDLNRKYSNILKVIQADDIGDPTDLKKNEEMSKGSYKLTYFGDNENDISENEDVQETNETLYQTAADFSFKSVLDEKENQDWKIVVKETKETVKKVEDYIYDDYETFRKEDYNQIAKNRSKTSSFIHKISKYGWTYTPPKNSARDVIAKLSTDVTPESDSSYIKYPDVFEDDHDNRENQGPQLKDDIIESVSRKLFDDKEANLEVKNVKEIKDKSEKRPKKKKYVLKRMRMSLEFLRTLTPKRSTFKRIESKVKYHRIKNNKSKTIKFGTQVFCAL